MPTLMLLRHAKSDWPKSGGSKLDDHDRPLSSRGRKDASRMGKYMRSEKCEPALVLCSTAARTRETWDLVALELKSKAKVRFEKALYLAAWPALLSIVQSTAATTPSLMLIGHNPGMEQLAIALALQPKTPSERARAENLSKKFPTCALAVLEFEGDWRAVKPGSGRLAAFVKPKDLESE